MSRVRSKTRPEAFRPPEVPANLALRPCGRPVVAGPLNRHTTRPASFSGLTTASAGMTRTGAPFPLSAAVSGKQRPACASGSPSRCGSSSTKCCSARAALRSCRLSTLGQQKGAIGQRCTRASRGSRPYQASWALPPRRILFVDELPHARPRRTRPAQIAPVSAVTEKEPLVPQRLGAGAVTRPSRIATLIRAPSSSCSRSSHFARLALDRFAFLRLTGAAPTSMPAARDRSALRPEP